MALVAYDQSDSSDFEEDDEKKIVAINSSVPVILHTTPNIMNSSSDIFKSLLPPNRQNFQPAEEEDDEFLRKKASDMKQKAKIMVPSLSDFKDVEGTKTNKPKGANGKKSGLLSMLPDPKNGVKITTRSLIPHSVSKKANTPLVKKLQSTLAPKIGEPIEKKPINNLAADYSDDDSENEDGTDFFSFNKKHEIIEDPAETISKEKVVSHAAAGVTDLYLTEPEEFTDQDNESIASTDTDYIEFANSAGGSEIQLDDEAIRQLCGSRGRRRKEDIEILNINQDEVLAGAREMLMKNIMDESQTTRTSAKRKGNGPTSQQKRKHQITYLAYQAKANEAELQNQWAQNRVSKRQTQSKYGF